MRIENEHVNAEIMTAYCDCDEPLKYVCEVHNSEKHVFVHCCIECKKFFELARAYPIHCY